MRSLRRASALSALLLTRQASTLTVATPTLTLPGTGDAMPQIGYGTWLSRKGEVYEGTKAALTSGYRHIDEAWVYMNEAEVGKAIKEALADGTLASREELWLTSKLWNNFHRPEVKLFTISNPSLHPTRDYRPAFASLVRAVGSRGLRRVSHKAGRG